MPGIGIKCFAHHILLSQSFQQPCEGVGVWVKQWYLINFDMTFAEDKLTLVIVQNFCMDPGKNHWVHCLPDLGIVCLMPTALKVWFGGP